MTGVGGWRTGGEDGGEERAVDHSDGDDTSTIETDAIAELGVDFAFRLDTDGTIEAVSGEVERLVGVPPEEVVGTGFEAYVDNRHLETAFDALETVLSGETVRGMALQLSGDEEPWVEVNAEPVRADDGDDGAEVVAVRGAAREATDRRRTIERRAEAMEGAMDGMALLDDDGRYLFVNEAHAELYGYEPGELVGSHWSRLYDESEQRRIEREALPAMETQGYWQGTAVGRRADGSTFQQALSLSDLSDGFVCVVRDVTDRHQREQIIEVLDRVLRHNLRNDMNVIMGEAEEIARTAEGQSVAAATRIQERARSLLTISDTARTVRKVVAGDDGEEVTDLDAAVRRCIGRVAPDRADITTSLPGQPVRVSCPGATHAVRELIENAVEHGSQRGRASSDTAAESDSAAPSAPGRQSGREQRSPDSDPERREQGNAGHSADDASVHIDLSREERAGARMAVLRVVDDGPGIPRMERVTLEEGHETPLRHGQGLGLWLVNWVATEAGGDLTVRERESGGTAVEMHLPLVDSGDE